MRKKDEIARPDSCLNKASEDEWLFVLRGKDVAAPAAVRAWIDERILLGKNKPEDEQISEAEAWIVCVREAQRNAMPPPEWTREEEEAARALHDAFYRGYVGEHKGTTTYPEKFDAILEDYKVRLLCAARQLLRNPPALLQKKQEVAS